MELGAFLGLQSLGDDFFLHPWAEVTYRRPWEGVLTVLLQNAFSY